MGLNISRDNNATIQVSEDIRQAKVEVNTATKELLENLFNDPIMKDILQKYDANSAWTSVQEALEAHRKEVYAEYVKLSVDSVDEAKKERYAVNSLLKPDMVNDMMSIRQSLAAFRYNQLVLALNCTQVVNSAFAMAHLWDVKYEQAKSDANKFLTDIVTFINDEYKPNDSYMRVHELIQNFETNVLGNVDPTSDITFPALNMDRLIDMEAVYAEHQNQKKS